MPSSCEYPLPSPPHGHGAQEVYAACGFNTALWGGSQAASVREAWRLALFGVLSPLGRLVESELQEKLEDTVTLSWQELRASDLSGRARAFQSMVGGGKLGHFWRVPSSCEYPLPSPPHGHGAQEGSRTPTPFREADFKSRRGRPAPSTVVRLILHSQAHCPSAYRLDCDGPSWMAVRMAVRQPSRLESGGSLVGACHASRD